MYVHSKTKADSPKQMVRIIKSFKAALSKNNFKLAISYWKTGYKKAKDLNIKFYIKSFDILKKQLKDNIHFFKFTKLYEKAHHQYDIENFNVSVSYLKKAKENLVKTDLIGRFAKKKKTNNIDGLISHIREVSRGKAKA